jgi:hypothetical protein
MWGLRASWIALPFTVGDVVGRELHGREAATEASVALWIVWAALLVATLVPHPVSLSAARIGAAAVPVVALTAAPDDAASIVAVVHALVVVGLAFAPAVGRVNVNGPAYGDERRFPLRVPGPLLLGPVVLAWSVSVGAPSATVLLAADRRWVPAIAVGAVGLPAAALAARALHQLSRRWIVFVPAGIVLHDHQALADPVLFTKAMVARLQSATADTDALDLTLAAPGLACELVLKESTPLGKRRRGRALGEEVAATSLLFTPTRPGAVLTEAATRKLATLTPT